MAVETRAEATAMRAAVRILLVGEVDGVFGELVACNE
jgi:hypothetical protein